MFSRKMGDGRNDPFFKPRRIGGAFFRHEGFRRQSLSVRARRADCPEGNLQTKRRLSTTPSGTLSYAWEGSHAFAKRQRLLSPKQYEIVEVRTSRGMNRALLFSNAILLAEWEANAPYARRWQSSASDGGPNRERPSSGPASEERVPRSRQELFGRG
jgi:hypothetical protein